MQQRAATKVPGIRELQGHSRFIAIALSVSVCFGSAPAFCADANKKSVALIPFMVPAPPAVHVPRASRVVSHPISKATIQRATTRSYPSTHFQTGMFLRQKGDLNGALIEFLKAAQENPMQVRAFYEQAVIFKQKGYTKLAQSALQQALAVRPDFRDARMMLASIHFEGWDLSEAARDLFNSLGFNTARPQPPAPKSTSSVARTRPGSPQGSVLGFRMPTLIQTPHGSLPLPAEHTQASGKSEDAFQQQPDLANLLKGIPPGISNGSDVQPLVPPPKPADINEIRSVSGNQLDDAAAKQVQQMLKQSGSKKRQRKHRVAAWLDNMLDGSHELAGDDPQKKAEPAVTEAGGTDVNPVAMLQKTAGQFEQDDDKQPATEPETKRESEPQSKPESSSEIQSNPETLPQTKPEEKPSWVPTPLDLSRLVRKALAFVPLPIFQPMEQSNSEPAAVPEPLGTTMTPGPAPQPIQPNSSASEFPQLAPQSGNASRAALTLPAPLPLPARTAAATALGGTESAALSTRNPGLDSVLSLLPKDIADTLQQVLAPQPVDISMHNSAAPQLQDLGARSTVPRAQAPSPVPAANHGVFENLVTARLAPAPFVPAPVRQIAPGPSAPAPAAVSVATIGSSNRTAPVVTSWDPAAGTDWTPGVPSGSGRGASRAFVPTLAPTASLGARPQAVPTIKPAGRISGIAPAPQPIQISSGSNPIPNLPAPSEYGRQSQPRIAIANLPLSTATMPPVPVASMPAPARSAAAATYVPTRIPDAPVQFVPSPVARRLSSEGFKFVAPVLTSRKQYVFTATNATNAKVPSANRPKPPAAAIPARQPQPPEDEYAKRMKFLLANGTSNLARGEAFMFSEETGEGVLFLANGSSIRRKVAVSRDAEEVARQRRPDILAPQGEMQYNLSLLGKILKPQSELKTTAAAAADPAAASNLSVNDLLGKSDGFFGWFKNVFKF